MRKLLLLLPLLLVLSGCVEEADETTYNCGQENCDAWEVCSYDQCMLKSGMCNVGGDCPSKICQEDHTCKPVDTAACDCKDWETCDDMGKCHTKQGRCNTGDDCANGVCDLKTNECRECTEDRHCPSFKICGENNICVLKDGGCYTDANCSGDKPLCQIATNSCVTCLSDANCSNDWDHCDVDAGSCVLKPGRCNANTDCTDPNKNLCGGADGHTCVFDCAACADHKECNNAATACVLKDGRCDEKSDCAATEKCDETNTCIFDCDSCDATWQQCNGDETACEPKAGMCGSDSDCAGEANDLTDCDEASHTCVFNCSTCTGDTICNEAKDACVFNCATCTGDQTCNEAKDGCIFDCTTCTDTGYQVCNDTDDACVLAPGKCNVKQDCSNGQICGGADNHSCIFDCSKCKEWETCNQNGNQCEVLEGRCNGHGDCDALNPVCNDVTHTCVDCTYDEQAMCSGSEVCEISSGTCVAAENCIASPDVVIAEDQFNFESYMGTDGYGDDYNPGNGGCGGYLSDGAAGEDLSFNLDLKKGDFVTVDVDTALGGDTILYVLSDCLDGDSCVAAADSTGSDEGEVLTFSVEADGSYLVVVDTWGTDYQLTYFNLNLTIHRQADVCDAGSCTAENTFCQSDVDGNAECICADGYHDENGSCVADTVCNPNPCAGAADGQTKCTDNAGSPVCSCEDNFFLKDGVCVPDTPCEPLNPCTDPNKTVCTVNGDQAECGCDAGYMDDGSGNCIAGEACEASVEALQTGSIDYDTNGTCGFGDDTTPKDELGYPNTTSGEDRMFKVELNAGDELTVTVSDYDFSYDPSLYILSSCEQGMTAYVAGSDSESGTTETLTFTATEAGTYYVVVDTFLSDSCMTMFNLDTTITPAVTEPACFGTTEELPRNGTYPVTGTMEGTEDNYNGDDCSDLGMDYTYGSDRLFKIQLFAGEELTVTITDQWDLDVALYVFDTCEAGATCLDYQDSSSTGSETLTYTAPADGTYFVVADGYDWGDLDFNLEISVQ